MADCNIYIILYNAVLWYYTFGQFHGNVTLVTESLIYILENNKSYVQNEALFRRVRWELNYFTEKCNILTRFLVDFYVTKATVEVPISVMTLVYNETIF
jgi:hypothetical protein